MFGWIFTSVPPWILIALVAIGVVLGTVAYLILLERKVAAWVQDRLGPNRVGPKGLLQPMADGLKFFFKEDYRPGGVDKVLFTLAPGVMMLVVLVAAAVIPWGGTYQSTHVFSLERLGLSAHDVAALPQAGAEPLPLVPSEHVVVSPEVRRVAEAAQQALPSGVTAVAVRAAISSQVTPSQYTGVEVTYQYPFQIARLNIGALFVVAVLSLAVYGIVVGGWASNNKYSFLGGLRATAQMISYEIPLGLSLLTVVLMLGTLELGEIVDKQAHLWAGFIPAWNVFAQPVAFLIFLVCIHAEANRAPFDLAEAEQELVGGYHTEYSSMRFALFFLSEYTGMIVTSAVCVALFFGGWHLPGLTGPADNPGVTTSFGIILLRCFVYFVKLLLVIFIFMWVRWSLPRFRFDQLMMLAWRGMIPIALALLVVTALVIYFVGPQSEALRNYGRIDGLTALILLGCNIGVVLMAMVLSRLLPAAPLTNRRLRVAGSRFAQTPLPPAATTAVYLTPESSLKQA